MGVGAGERGADWLAEQYRDGANLTARVELHRRFSTNPQGWLRWVFERLAALGPGALLEVGCGTGELWWANRERLPAAWRVVLSDRSPGMLAGTRDRLADLMPHAGWLVADAQAIPCADDAFDVVVADHMLYHVPDRPRALAEFRRVLRPGGWLLAATNGMAHLRELDELLCR